MKKIIYLLFSFFFITSSSLNIPSLNTFLQIIGTDATIEIGTDQDIINISNFEISILDPNQKNCFVIVLKNDNNFFSQFNKEFSSPLTNVNGQSSYFIYETLNNIYSIISTIPSIIYTFPVSSLYKQIKGLFNLVSSNDYLSNQDQCQAGLRITCAPGFTNYESLKNQIINDVINNNVYMNNVLNRFYWMASNNPRSVPTETISNDWVNYLNPVVNTRTIFCDFSQINIIIDEPNIIIQNLCFLNNNLDSATSCLLSLIAYLSTLSNISLIENMLVIKPTNIISAGIAQSGNPNYRPLWDIGLDGTNQIAQISDTGVYYQNCYFVDSTTPPPITSCNSETTCKAATYDTNARKIIQYIVFSTATVDDDYGHGTHCAGTIAGYNQGTTLGVNTYNGIAPYAKLAVFDMGTPTGSLNPPGNYNTTLFPPGYIAGARVFSCSWSSTSNSYSSNDKQVDDFMYYNDEAILLGAASNDGANGKNTVNTPWVSKNGITVCSSVSASSYSTSRQNISLVSYFSGIGPTKNGRIVPTICSPGQLLRSAGTNTVCGVTDKQGTSMATPSMAGQAMLIRQYFMDGWYPTGVKSANPSITPSGALVKAMLINSAVPLTGYGITSSGASFNIPIPPNIYQGWGRTLLMNVLQISPTAKFPILYIQDRKPITTNEIHVYKFTIVPISTTFEAFRCTITWTEASGDVAAAFNVINNLDMYITRDADTKNTTIYPNNLNRPDTLNNIERIVIDKPTPNDVITVRIKGTSITLNSPQNYAFVVSGTYAKGAYYCRNSKSAVDTSYRTEYCRIPCGTIKRDPICCSSDAGNVCVKGSSFNSDTHCTTITKPSNC